MRSVLLFLLLSPALACRAPDATATQAVPHHNCHPSCPGAHAPAAAPIAPLHEALAFEPSAAAAPAPSAATYVCPMHAHVGAEEPGRCPECGMQLVLRAAPEHDHDR